MNEFILPMTAFFIWVFVYSFIGGLYYKHTEKMGHWLPGVIVAVLWPIEMLLWTTATVLVFFEDYNFRNKK